MINLFDDPETKNSLTSRVFRQIEREILDGTLAPGTALTELKLSEQLGVSRTPVREALFQQAGRACKYNSEQGRGRRRYNGKGH